MKRPAVAEAAGFLYFGGRNGRPRERRSRKGSGVMDYFEVIRKRRSIRAFQPRPVEPEKLRRVLEAADLAPSAGNLQAYEILVARDGERKRALAQAALGQAFVAQAPVVLGFAANRSRSAAKYGRRGAELYALQDATIACAYAQLAATAEGLATVWVGAFDDDAVAEALDLPEGLRPAALLPLGYAAEEPEPTPRRSLEEIARELPPRR